MANKNANNWGSGLEGIEKTGSVVGIYKMVIGNRYWMKHKESPLETDNGWVIYRKMDDKDKICENENLKYSTAEKPL